MRRPLSIILLILLTLSWSTQLRGQSKPGIQSAFDPNRGQWEISWPGRIAQYDLIELTPPNDPMQGIPLGNGELGVLCWCDDSRLIAVVNKSDHWDDATFGPFHNWNRQEEDFSTTQRQACRIIIDFKQPVFSPLYLSQFKGRLSLADGTLYLDGGSPFGTLQLKAFVDKKSGLLFFTLHSDLKEDTPLEITLDRYGSRTYSHWYSQINRDATIGLSGTESEAGSDGILIRQRLSSGTFAVGGRVIATTTPSVQYTRQHSRGATITLSGSREKQSTIAFAVTSPLEQDPIAEVKKSLQEIEKKGIEPYERSNSEAWREIWSRSFLDYGDDYLTNLWYLSMYYFNASQGGRYPGRFNNGLWSWDHDVQNWNFYFHWNQQQLFWPLNAAGFPELITPYLDFRFRSLPQAQKDAKRLFGVEGAFISDVTERRGFNSSGEKINHTPIAEMALDFWRQYQFTCDRTFLHEKALPFILEASRFFETRLAKEGDGLYHAKEGSGYEGWIHLRDGLTELVYAKVLLTTALEALKVDGTTIPEAARWQEIVTHLAPLPTLQPDEQTIRKEGSAYILRRGFFKGEPVPTNTMLAAGWGIKENKMMLTYFPVGLSDTLKSRHYPNNGIKLLDGIFPSVPSSPVYPSGLIGLAQKGTPDFQNAITTLLYNGAEITGWDPVPIAMARLGMAKELAFDLQRYPSRWQIYCNGWGHWGVEEEINKDAEWFFRTNQVSDVKDEGKGAKFPLPMWPFRHMSMEAMSVLTTAMNESMLQSHDGILRIAPAFDPDHNGRFTLHARGGFIVSAEIKKGLVQWVAIRSLHGNRCQVALPWASAYRHSSWSKKGTKLSGKVVQFATRANELILLTPEKLSNNDWTVVAEQPLPNENPKNHHSGKTRLGIPRMY